MKPSNLPEMLEPDNVDAHLGLYLDAVHRGDRRGAIDEAMRLLENGVDAERIITDLLARSQREIGRGWAEGRWSVALEHRASAITESALQAVSETVLRAPGALVEGSRGRTVVACSEGEWHVLPGRMASEVLRLRGVDVSFIGPSVPAEELAAMLGENPPPAVAITCSMPRSLTGSWRTISAMRALGMTIVCGGRGFGRKGEWGLALGADLWAPDFSTGADLLLNAPQSRPSPRDPIGNPALVGEVGLLRRDHGFLVEAATANALTAWPYLRETDAALRATREDLDSTLGILESATLLEDPVIVTDYAQWFESVLAARDLPLSFVPTAFALLLEVIPDELQCARRMANVGLEVCTAAPMQRGGGAP